MSDYPSLQPAMTILVPIGAPLQVGKVGLKRHTPCGRRTRSLSIPALSPDTPQPMTGINIKSEPGFSPEIDAELLGTANDFIHNDPSGKHMRLNAHGAVKDKSGGVVYVKYTGVVAITPELGAILSAKEGAKSTEFGDSFIEMKFETGDEKLKVLETGVFVGAGRFVVEKEKPVTVEYKVSQVVKGK